jgi:hypothetical protein
MAVGVLMMAPGMTQQNYDQINEAMFGPGEFDPGDAPEGLLVHSAGPAEGGWYVYDIWESREAFERFANERLMQAMQKVLGGPPPGDGPQFFEIANLFRA